MRSTFIDATVDPIPGLLLNVTAPSAHEPDTDFTSNRTTESDDSVTTAFIDKTADSTCPFTPDRSNEKYPNLAYAGSAEPFTNTFVNDPKFDPADPPPCTYESAEANTRNRVGSDTDTARPRTKVENRLTVTTAPTVALPTPTAARPTAESTERTVGSLVTTRALDGPVGTMLPSLRRATTEAVAVSSRVIDAGTPPRAALATGLLPGGVVSETRSKARMRTSLMAVQGSASPAPRPVNRTNLADEPVPKSTCCIPDGPR